MSYISRMKRLFKCDGAVYREMLEQEVALRYSVVNVLLAGLLYGVSSVYFGQTLLNVSGESGVGFSGGIMILVGISVAFLLHAGAALFVWVFCRAMGGNPQFMPPYLNLGVASIVMWPLIPALAALQVGMDHPLLIGYIGLGGLLGARAMYYAIKSSSGLSDKRMIIASTATLVYIGCFLYLWV